MSDDWLRDSALPPPPVSMPEGLCPHCGEPVGVQEVYCSACGEPLSPPPSSDDDELLAAKYADQQRVMLVMVGLGLGIAALGVLLFHALWPLVRRIYPQ